MNRIDIITDLETLGTGADCPVFQIGAVAVDVETGDTISTLNVISDITKFNNIEGGTLKWWLKTNKDLLANLVLATDVSKDDIIVGSEEEMNEVFVTWVGTLTKLFNCDAYLWGNGILFDNRIIEGKCKKYGMEYPIKYYNDRDLRTIYELAAKKLGFADARELRASIEIDNRVAHDGLSDAEHEAKVFVYAWNTLLG